MFSTSRPSRLILAFLLFAAAVASAVDPTQPASTYLRTTFTVEDGLSSNVVNAIVQTRNGFLWLGTDAGLERFNGHRFTPIYFRGPQSTPQGIVSSLAEGPDGDLWAGTSAGLVRIPSTALDYFDRSLTTFYHLGDGGADEITTLRSTADGALLVGTAAGLFRFLGGRFETLLADAFINCIEVTANGHLLIVTQRGFLELAGSSPVPHPGLPQELKVAPDAIFHVFEDREGIRWFATSAGLVRIANGKVERIGPYGGPHAPAALRVFQDLQDNLWKSESVGVFRVSEAGFEPLMRYTPVRTMYADRENNLWLGTNGEGLIRFKDRPVRMFTKNDGLPNNIPMAVLLRRDGTLWIGLNCGLSVFDGERFRMFTEKDGLTNSCVWSLAEGLDGDLWLGTWGGGLIRYSHGRFTTLGPAQGLAGDVARSVVAARDGSVWVATQNGLSQWRNGRFRTYTVADGLSSNRVVAVYQDRNGGIWAGTSRGLNRLAGDRFAAIASQQQVFEPRYISMAEDTAGNLFALSAPRGIDRIEQERLVPVNHDLDLLGMLALPGGDVWFTGANGLFRLSADSLEHPEIRSSSPLDYAAFGRTDGMASAQCSIGSPNMALGPDGKLWVATVQGLAMLDLRRLAVDKSKPKVYVDEAIVGREARPAGRELILPPGTHHVELHFDSISLGWPEKLRFQYRMDDVDPVWLDAGNNRAAVYTSIPIGAHTFHVRACNSSGVWDRTGIIFRVTQKPFFYETVLFRLAMAALFGLLLAAGYKLRVQQVTSQMQARLNERVAERTRVARELHDTLLQTIQASKILADASLDGPADTARMQGTLKRLSEWLGRAVQESRAALSSLRLSAIQHNDIAESLRATAGENCKSGVIDIVFTVEGSGREVHPIVHDEVYRIGCEAIRNACAHSGGSRIDVEISYARDLVLRVRDNGRGIDAQVLAAGKEGHFGLKGIRERADRLGGKLNLNSSSAGTSVELIVPDGLAFSNRRTATGEVRVRVLRFFGLQL